MDINGALTVSGTYTDTAGNCWPYDGGCMPNTQPTYYHYVWPNYQTIEVEPKSCMGKAHVFECEHVESCKCGAIKRVMPRAKKAAKAKK